MSALTPPLGACLNGELRLHLRDLKAPVIASTFVTLGDQVRTEGWSHETYLVEVWAGKSLPESGAAPG